MGSERNIKGKDNKNKAQSEREKAKNNKPIIYKQKRGADVRKGFERYYRSWRRREGIVNCEACGKNLDNDKSVHHIMCNACYRLKECNSKLFER